MKRLKTHIGVEIAAAFAVVLGAFSVSPAVMAKTVDAAPQADGSVALEANSLSEEKSPHRLVAEGDVEARYDGRVLRADRVIYNLDTKRVFASGNVQIVDPDGSIRFAEELEVDDKLKDGVATNFAGALPGNATVLANSAIRRDGDKTLLGQVIYTACPICDAKGLPKSPTWTLRARRATQNQKTKMISYRDAVFELHGVPVFYLPYFTHVDPTTERRSGLLPPKIAQSSTLGAYYEQPYYWAISPSQDLTIAPRVHGDVNPLLSLKYRKKFYSGELDIEGSVTNEQLFGSDGTKFGPEATRGSVFARGVWQASDYWKWGFGVEEVSDDLYTIRYKIPGEEQVRGPFWTRPYNLIDQVYAEGRGKTSSSLISAMKFNDLTIANDKATLPQVLPYVSILKRLDNSVYGGDVTLDFNAVGLTRADGGADSQRTSVGAAWNTRSVVGPGILLEPFVEARGDYYKVSDYPTPASAEESFGRGYATAGAVARWPFRRSGAVDIIVEPIAMVALGTDNPNDARIPNEDSPSFELDETSLFRGNAAPNYDLVEGGARASFGVRVSAYAPGGVDASAFLGRRWRASPDSAFSQASNLAGTASDYIAAFETNFAQKLRLNLRLRLDGEDLTVQRIDGGASTNLGPLTLGVRYYKYDAALAAGAPSEQAQVDAALKLHRNWRVDYSILQDFQSNTALTQRIGLVYNDNCTTIGLYYDRRETQNRQIGPSDGFMVRFALATLGSFGAGSDPNR